MPFTTISKFRTNNDLKKNVENPCSYRRLEQSTLNFEPGTHPSRKQVLGGR